MSGYTEAGRVRVDRVNKCLELRGTNRGTVYTMFQVGSRKKLDGLDGSPKEERHFCFHPSPGVAGTLGGRVNLGCEAAKNGGRKKLGEETLELARCVKDCDPGSHWEPKYLIH